MQTHVHECFLSPQLLDCAPGDPVLDAPVPALSQGTGGPPGPPHSDPLSQLLAQPHANGQTMEQIQQLYTNLLR